MTTKVSFHIEEIFSKVTVQAVVTDKEIEWLTLLVPVMSDGGLGGERMGRLNLVKRVEVLEDLRNALEGAIAEIKDRML